MARRKAEEHEKRRHHYRAWMIVPALLAGGGSLPGQPTTDRFIGTVSCVMPWRPGESDLSLLL